MLDQPDPDFAKQREQMIEKAIRARGVRSKLVLDAMASVPRESFLPAHLREFAYEDSPLPIEQEQTISQPYIVAFMIEALGLEGGERVLEIGAGSGYAAAVLSKIAGEVYTVERIGQLAEKAAATLADLGCDNVRVLHGDGTKGWPEHMPYDGIVVAAGGPKVPDALKLQLKVGGRLVIPVGSDPNVQELVRITRVSEQDFKREDLADVRFVPLVGEEGWAPPRAAPAAKGPFVRIGRETLAQQIGNACERMPSVDTASLEPLLKRIGDARVVLLGEATHGTAEFYRMRERITRELIQKKGFRFVAIEGDWPDAARIDHYVRHMEYPPSEWTAFTRFPAWMWRNNEVRAFVDWLRAHNAPEKPERRVAFHGLDLYSLYDSIRAVLKYLDEVDPPTAKVARQRYGCLTPWQTDPATYGHAALTGKYEPCEPAVTEVLTGLMSKRSEYALHDGERFMDAMQNARLIANAERYYRIMYYGSRASWNLRDKHMFETLKTLLAFYGRDSRAVVWAHNSHIGNAAATEMTSRGEHNLGQLCREEFGDKAYLVGFGTHGGQVAAASEWNGPMEIKTILPSLRQSYEHHCHESGVPSFFLNLRGAPRELRTALRKPRLQRAIGVIYRPETERASHYFQAVLPDQFDEYIWFNQTAPVTPFATHELEDMPDTYPFGL
ncbi:MAG: protein-L-isoaspartate(D-aspartate) O-methyltransferase [Pseudorhodoplanes sp.]|jgi:protein-L-isoaspartate(D-aspartate) O-methyltransferase|nr:protein-L-isoaspartate(D-aspartate) O-methyltransferase [Pseudorhodoplanes sp.]